MKSICERTAFAFWRPRPQGLASRRGNVGRTDQEAIRLALSGDTKAMRALVDRLAPVVQGVVARGLLRARHRSERGVRQDVEDLTQEVFETLLDRDGKTLRAWDPGLGRTLESYVRLVAERHVISALRSRRRSPYTEDARDEIELPSRSDERAMVARDTMRALHAGLRERLSPKGLEVFELLCCRELSPDEVAEELSLSRPAVYMWRTRIREAAREIAAELEGTR